MKPLVKEWPNLNTNEIIKKVLQSVKQLHESKKYILVDANEVEEDIELEFYEKLVSRFESIESLLDKSIFKYKDDILTLARKATNEIKESLININKTIPYVILHGDLNFSNILTDGENIKFIDPRAYFGKHENYRFT